MYTCMTSARHGASAIDYVLQEAGHYKEKRNDVVAGVNLDLSGATSVTEQMQHYWDLASSKNKTQVRRIVISFSDKEFSDENEEDVRRAAELSRDCLAEMYPDRQILVCTQSDGKGGKLHVHALVNNVSITDRAGLKSNERSFWYLKNKIDGYFEKNGVKIDPGEAKRNKVTQTERAHREAGEYVWKDDLRQRIFDAKMQATCYEDFIEILEQNGVSYKDSGKHNVFTLEDTSRYEASTKKKPSNPLHARGYKLADDEYTTERLKAALGVRQITAPVIEEKPVETIVEPVEAITEPEVVTPVENTEKLVEQVETAIKEPVVYSGRRTRSASIKPEAAPKTVETPKKISEDSIRNILARNERIAKYYVEENDDEFGDDDIQKQETLFDISID